MRDIDNVLNMIQERTFTKSKIVFWEQTLPGIVKALYKASVIAKKYRLWVKKMEREEPQEWAEPGIELIVSQQSVIGAALEQSERNKEDLQKNILLPYLMEIILMPINMEKDMTNM
jgi:hypothetical protein